MRLYIIYIYITYGWIAWYNNNNNNNQLESIARDEWCGAGVDVSRKNWLIFLLFLQQRARRLSNNKIRVVSPCGGGGGGLSAVGPLNIRNIYNIIHANDGAARICIGEDNELPFRPRNDLQGFAGFRANALTHTQARTHVYTHTCSTQAINSRI